MRQALEQGQLRLHYQPIYDLRQGSISGFEASRPRAAAAPPTLSTLRS
ncbi:hypothetical protein [Staphylococcus aureus]|nr:hypothetical protein [Staphylococcus aureus]